ncbi:MAG: glycoside hydrolase family 38 C-terminal domain-containing protein [Candidatus Microbacterium phytovorans]|uniref:Glycoside hydrolase family 38 C-terminal domain-containing protein n=1 Tax=Candidatus Microbacterium phytovorans TaxID=3121374 RepID=A0AAJ6B3F3_9MICO|nr:glycoside hydrolase family 38 C-terminal domain-containing protein [Microbacterium sp.]WEK13009.1 MAG: glycoside hydrolase family 38 C-terminal domain-containing protein [Microbacterium sp.]
MRDRRERVLARTARAIRDDVRPALHSETAPVSLAAWSAPGEPVPFADAVGAPFTPIATGDAWGRPWGTVWVRVSGRVPRHWHPSPDARNELAIDLGFLDWRPGFQCEALVWSADGRALKGIEPAQRHFVVPEDAGEEFVYYIEAAANPDVAQHFSFRPTTLGDPQTAGEAELYRWGRIELARRHVPTTELLRDLDALTGLVRESVQPDARREEVLTALEAALNRVDPGDVAGSAPAARAELAEVLARPAAASAHRLHAVGHAHIDSAWLWPLRETRRKVARSFANVLALMDRYDDFVFAATSAQQYAWVKEDYPELYARVAARVAEGRFIPTGGQWVEPDCNLPSGESLARQLIEGKRFFLEEFGIETDDVWIPDSFGYSGGLPQIAAAAGARYFLTQKISWNETNTFPHHSFLWEGIDGTRIFTHFPSADTYHAEVSAADLRRAESQFADKGATNLSLLPFGWGDGGGGPTEDMLASAARYADLEGAPRVIMSSPERFFTEAAADLADPPVWVGELYLERHRGVATTQIPLKRGNRRAERLLREAELWATAAMVQAGAAYPGERLRALWREVLLLQFHDILPGSSITWVHREAHEAYERVHAELEEIVATALRALVGTGDRELAVNASPVSQSGIAALAGAASAEAAESTATATGVTVAETAEGTVVDNGILRLTVDAAGEISSLIDGPAGRDLVPAGMRTGRLRLHHDTPTTWDAWDLDEHYRARPVEIAGTVEVTTLTPTDDVVTVRVSRSFGASSVRLDYTLRRGAPRLEIDIDLDWHEDQKLLKLQLPLDLHTDHATAEVAYGHLRRAIHTNTSWDEARFEVVAHRWLHVGEPGYGVALANEATYGYDTTRESAGGRSVAVIGISLARAPRYPDPTSDRGRHSLRFTLRPGAGVAEAVEEGYRLGVPLRRVTDAETTELAPLLSVAAPGVMVESVKAADDGSGDVIVRLYEAWGTRTRGTLTPRFPVAGVVETDLLERDGEPAIVRGHGPDGAVDIELRPFQLATVRWMRQPRTPEGARR